MQFPFEKSASPSHSRCRYFRIWVPPLPPTKYNGKLNSDISHGMEWEDICDLEMSGLFTSTFPCRLALLMIPLSVLRKRLGGRFPASPCNYPGCMARSNPLPTASKTVTTGTSLCICQLRMIKKEASRGPIFFFFLFKTFGNNLNPHVQAHSLALLSLPITAPVPRSCHHFWKPALTPILQGDASLRAMNHSCRVLFGDWEGEIHGTAFTLCPAPLLL